MDGKAVDRIKMGPWKKSKRPRKSQAEEGPKDKADRFLKRRSERLKQLPERGFNELFLKKNRI